MAVRDILFMSHPVGTMFPVLLSSAFLANECVHNQSEARAHRPHVIESYPASACQSKPCILNAAPPASVIALRWFWRRQLSASVRGIPALYVCSVHKNTIKLPPVYLFNYPLARRVAPSDAVCFLSPTRMLCAVHSPLLYSSISDISVSCYCAPSVSIYIIISQFLYQD